MTDKSRHNDENSPAPFEHFPEKERTAIRDIWDKSANAQPKQPEVTDWDIEEALSAVHNRMDVAPSEKQESAIRSLSWRWTAVAAVILLIAGAGFLYIPKTVTASRGEMATVELPDGSTVELNSGSEIKYNRLFDITNRDIQLNGEAYFSVKKGDSHFIVSAHNTKVEVLGTKFNVRSWNDEPGRRTEVTVTEGAVHFYRATFPDSAVVIRPGKLSTLSTDMDKPTDPKSIAVDRITGWRNHRLIFNNRSLQVIFDELERRFNTTIRLEAQNMSHETLTAYYDHPKNLESVLTDICRVKGLRFSKTTDGYRVYK